MTKCSRINSKEGTYEKPAKAALHSSTRTKEKINEREKKQRDARKPSPLSDYECSLDKSYKASLKAKRVRKDVAQLGQQSKQSIDPLVVAGDFTNAPCGPIDKEALQDFMATTGLIAEQLMGGASIPTSDYDIYRTYVYGQNLVNPKYYSSLGMQMFLLNKWYLKVTENDEAA